MLRKALGGAALAGAAGMLAAGVASPAAAQDYDPADFGGVNVLSNWCIGNWNGDVISILKIADVEDRSLCNGWDQNPDGINVASNICALNWDWNDAANLALIGNVKDYELCDWSEDEMHKLMGYSE